MRPELIAAQKVVAAARHRIPAALLRVSGRALYSPASTLVSGSRYYFLGVMPGEAPLSAHLHSTITVEADLKRLEEGSISEHGYLDEQWKNYAHGQAPIQSRGQHLFALLAGGSPAEGLALLRATPTSNFVLQRSASVEALEQRVGASALTLAQQYWPFHQAVIRETGCTVVLTHAIVLARQIARSLGLGEGQARPSGWSGTLRNCYAWRLPEGPTLLAVPNLSRYSPNGPREPALVAFFKEFLPKVAQ
jgi:hypothetical protein